MLVQVMVSEHGGRVTVAQLHAEHERAGAAPRWAGTVACAAGQRDGFELGPDATIGEAVALVLAARAELEGEQAAAD